MTAVVGWSALAVALALVSVPSAAAERAGALAGRGRLRSGAASQSRRRVPGRRAWRAVAIPAATLAVASVALAGGVLLAVASAAALGAGITVARDVEVARAAARRHRDLLTAMRVAVGELEVGAAPSVALGAAAAAGPRVEAVFAAASAAAARGDDAGAVLVGAAERDLQVVGLAWRLGDATGAALGGVLARVAADLEAADDQRRTVATALAGPRSSAALLAGLPLLGIGLGATMGARPVPFLITTSAGRLLCCVGVLLDVAGVLWMRRILRRAEQA